LPGGLAILALAAAIAAASAKAADDELALRLADWQKVETAPETKSYREALRSGGGFDEARRKHLEEVILPQLARDTNRRIITKVRHRIPAIALRDAARNQQAYAGVVGSILRFMEALARDETASLVARVNAAMLVGELDAADGKPLVESVRPLVGMATDSAMPMAVRVVSFSAVGRLLEAVRSDAALREAVVNAGVAVLQELETADPVSHENALPRRWMAARAIDMLPELLEELPAETATVLTRIVQKDGPVDLRVRAAVALGRISTARSKVDVGGLVTSIGAIAAVMLAADEEIGRRNEVAQFLRSSAGDPSAGGYAAMGPAYGGAPAGGPGDFFGGAPPGGGLEGGGFFGPGSIDGAGGMPPGGFGPPMGPVRKARTADSPPEQVFRRTAWRLLQLVRALEGEDGTKGLAALGSDEETSRAKELARILLNGSDSLDETPDVATLRKLVAVVSPKPPEEKEPQQTVGPDGRAPEKAPTVKPRPDAPFDPFQ